jgi:hypothetical protein
VEGKKVHHRDGDATNYHADNLVPLTHEEHLIADRKMRAKRAKKLSEQLKAECPF